MRERIDSADAKNKRRRGLSLNLGRSACGPYKHVPAPLLLFVLLTDRRGAPLQVGIADGAIEIDGGFRNALEAVEV